MSKLLPIIGIVVIVAIVAVAAVVIMNDDDDDNKNGSSDWEEKDYGTWEPTSTDVGLLTVFGNANADSVINADDATVIQNVIDLTAAVNAASDSDKAAKQLILDNYLATLETLSASKTYKGTAKDYYLADANCDGKINSLDLAIVNKIIKIQASVHNYCNGDCTEALSLNDLKTLGIGTVNIFYYDVDSVLASFTYPLTGDMAIGYKSNYESVLICGANSRCTYACNQVADSTSTYYQWYHSYYSTAKNIGSRFTPDYEVFVESGAPQMFITGTRAWFDGDMESTLSPLDVSVVRLPFWEDNICDSSVVTLGFLIGCQQAANTYAKKVTDVVDAIAEAVKDIKLEDRPLVFQSYNGTSISTMHNGIHEAVYAAGGKTPYDVGYSNGSIDIEEVNLNMKPDYIGLDQYYGFLENWNLDNPKESWDKMVAQMEETSLKYAQAINQSDAYNNDKVFCFNQGTYMGPASYITIAYMFNCIYADNSSISLHFDVDALFKDYLACYHPDLDIEDFVYDGVNVQYYLLSDLEDAIKA